jgi:type III pantothenate kinase
MLLAIDVGNTNVTLGVFEHGALRHSWRMATLREKTSDEVGLFLVQLFHHRGIPIERLEGIVIASVVPPLTGTMVSAAEVYCGRRPLVIESTTRLGMKVLYDNPAEVGADRIVNAVAAYEQYGRAEGRPLIVVDFGTATTFDAVSGAGEYLGGIICPGIQISADALFQKAARLPRVDVRKPPTLIGRNTVASMQSGLFFGYVAMVEGIVHRMRRDLDPASPERVCCIATGGMARVLAGETEVIEEANEDLTLHGLRIIWERSAKAGTE